MRERKIRRNHGSEQPTSIVFFDCETLTAEVEQSHADYVHQYRLSVTQVWRRHLSMWREGEMKRWVNRHEMWKYILGLCRKGSVLTVMAHNAIFDLTVSDFWSYIDGGEIILHGDIDFHTGKTEEFNVEKSHWKGLFVCDDRRVIIEGCHSKGRINVLDSMNYYRQSLAAVGESIGIDKMPMPDFAETDEAWFEYCENDVRILAHSITRLMSRWKDNDLGNWQPTASSLAWSNFRHRHLSVDIVTHDDKIASALEREAHIGGECRCFFAGDILTECDINVRDWRGPRKDDRPYLPGPVYLYDVRSLYPHIMRSTRLPRRLLHSQEGSTLRSLERLCERYFVVAHVAIANNFARWPLRKHSHNAALNEDRIVYPVGEFTTTLCGMELNDAVKRGVVVNSYELACYEQDYLFTSYVNYWWEKRRDFESENNAVGATLCKLMLNSLYGRFAMGRKQWVQCPEIYPQFQWGTWLDHDCDSNETLRCRAIGGNVFVERVVEAQECALTAISAGITAAGRMMMRTIRGILPPKSCLYQDTDSLMVTAAGRDALDSAGLIDPVSLGSLSLKGEYESARLFGPRNYDIDGAAVIAGLPSRRENIGGRRYAVEIWDRAETILSRSCQDSIGVKKIELDFSCGRGSDLPMSDGWTVPASLSEYRTPVSRPVNAEV